MTETKKIFIKSLISGLKIDVEGNPFEYQAVVDGVEFINEADFMDFYNEARRMNTYGDGVKAITETAKKFKNEKTDNLLAGTHNQAKEMYNKFYSESMAMLDYTAKNRERCPSDKDFFNGLPYEILKRTDGTPTYTKQELYVMDKLGAGEFLLGIRLALSSKDIIDKIERVIKEAVMTKYSNQPAISYEVKKMLPK